jgi:hypothetical protein
VIRKSSTFQQAWKKRAQVNVNDSYNDYFTDLNRIASTRYKPTDNDIIISSSQTISTSSEHYDTGEEFTIEGRRCEFYEASGRSLQSLQLRKFDAILFMISLSDYDNQSPRENRMLEALFMFESLKSKEFFKRTPIALIFNKRDLFAKKIKHSNIQDFPFFSDYCGPAKDFDAGAYYFIARFQEFLRKRVFLHVTDATDTIEQMHIFDILDMLLFKKQSFDDVIGRSS